MRRLLVATSNEGKLRELGRLFAATGITLVRPGDLGLALEVDETGDSFEANARIKAAAYFAVAGIPTLGEDSGLEIACLGGEPGVLSARYHNLPDGPTKNAHILDLVGDRPPAHRRCTYVCVMVLIEPGGVEGGVGYIESTFHGRCSGQIAREPAGSGGFGFDPIVRLPRLRRTMAELNDAQKDAISHRARAARKLLAYLSGATTV